MRSPRAKCGWTEPFCVLGVTHRALVKHQPNAFPSFLKKESKKKEPIFGKQSTEGGKRFQLKTLKFSMESLKKLKIAHVTLLMPPQGPGQALPAPRKCPTKTGTSRAAKFCVFHRSLQVPTLMAKTQWSRRE